MANAVPSGNRPAAPSVLDSDELREATIDRRILRRMKRLGRETCGVCLGEFEEGHDAAQLECGHWFHTGAGSDTIDETGMSCLVGWLAANHTCPVCRFELPTADANYEMSKMMSNESQDGSSGRRTLLQLSEGDDDGGPSGKGEIPHGIFG
jgi:RING-like zinc finger